LRVHYDDPVLKQRIVHWLCRGMRPGVEQDAIHAAAADFDQRADAAERLADRFLVEGDVALLHVPADAPAFDKTELLLVGQRRATVAVVVDGVTVNIAASFESGLNFITLLGLGGGMPTRVSVPVQRLDDVLRKIRAALRERGGPT
jgi:hypothetical protein